MGAAVIDRTRRNHALEHGTVTVLLERGVRPPLGGLATPAGYLLYARSSTEEIASAASEALDRLRAGERELAVSPYCGTNLMVGAVMAGLLTATIMSNPKRRLRRLPLLAGALIGSTLLRRPVGNEVQRRLTTLADVGGVEITAVRPLSGSGAGLHWIGTGNATPLTARGS